VAKIVLLNRKLIVGVIAIVVVTVVVVTGAAVL